MDQTKMLERPEVLLISTRKGMRERLAGHRVVESADAEQLDEQGRASVRAAVLGSLDKFTAADMDRYPNLRFMTTLGAGAEGIDAAAAAARGIQLTTGAGVNADDVADIAVALFLVASRRMIERDARVRRGEWRLREIPPVHSVSAHKVGIVSMGAIGRAVAHRLAGFRCEVAWTGPNPKPDVALPYFPDLQELARWADALIIAAPLNKETAGSVNREVIDALGSRSVIVNVGRGGIVDEDELIAALKDGRLSAAGLDVFAQEPTPPERWADVPNVILSPHAAAVTFEVYDAIVERAGERVDAFLGSAERS